jgi:multiple sugar transport system permease protein
MDTGAVQRKAAGRGFAAWFHKAGIGYLFLLPFLILFFMFVLLPVLIAIGLSFTNYNMIQPPSFVGLDNYRLLFIEDDIFFLALKNTLMFAVITGPLGFLLSFLLAIAINDLKFKKVFALLFYAPSLTSAIAMSVVWLYIFSGDRYGWINNMLFRMGAISEPILWNNDPRTILGVIIFVSAWMSMGNGFLVFIAGLQNLDVNVYEAARVDGVRHKLQEIVYITVPMMKPQLLFSAITATVAAIGVFDVSVAIAGMPSPNYAGHTIVTHLYDYAFMRLQMGYSSAIAVVLFAVCFSLSRIFMKVFASGEE